MAARVMVQRSYTLDDVAGLGVTIAAALRPGVAMGLSGDLGAGKTSLARSILRAMGYTDDVPSPSFALVQPYAPPAIALPVLHVDLYRLGSDGHGADIAELGLRDALIDHVLLIEWPERLCGLPGNGIGMASLPMLHISDNAAKTGGDIRDSRILTTNDHTFWNDVIWPIQ